MSQLLATAAECAGQHQFLMAGPLNRFAAVHGLARDGLAAWLGCSTRSLDGLSLCWTPDLADGAGVAALAEFIGCDVVRLQVVVDEAGPGVALPPGERGAAWVAAHARRSATPAR